MKCGSSARSMCMIVPRSSGMRSNGIVWTPSIAALVAIALEADDELPTVERLSLPAGRIRLHSPQTHQRLERVLAEPVPVALRPEMGRNRLHLPLRDRVGQVDEHVRRAEVSVVLRDLVLENQVVSK